MRLATILVLATTVACGVQPRQEAAARLAPGSGVDASLDADGAPAAAPAAAAAAALVQHVSGSNLRDNALASPFCYRTALASPAQAGNAIVVGVTWKGSATLRVTDDAGDTYTDAKTFRDTADNQSVGAATAFNVAAGARSLSVCFSSNPGGWVQPMVTEFANVVALDGASAGSGAGTTATAGTLTPGPSDLLYQFVYTPGGPPRGFAASPGATLLGADIQDGFAGQYGGSSPSLSLGSSARWVTAALQLRTGAAGSVPAGMRIVRLEHLNLPVSVTGGGTGNSYPTPTPVEFPCSGNLLIAAIAGGNGTPAPPFVTNLTDSASNAWTLAKQAVSGDAMTQLFYAPHASPGNLMLSATWNDVHTDDTTIMLYDVIGASSAPLDVAAGGGGADNVAGGSLTLPFMVTPSQLGELVVVATPWDFNTAGALNGGLMDTNFADGESESGPVPVDENNGWGHAFNSSLSPMRFTWVPRFNEIPFGSYSSVAAAFRRAP